jgi:DNA-directed RNA polymerase specialized sigma24 family protein
MMELDVEKITHIARRAALSVTKLFPDSTVDDLSQEIWLWVMAHTHKLEEWGEEWEGKLWKTAFREALAVARRERAAIAGYEPRDEYFYRIGTLRKILPLFYGEAYDEIIVPDRDAVLDLERAFTKIDVQAAALLYEVFGQDDAEGRTKALAAAWEVSDDAARQKVQRALKKLQEALGGPDPYYDPPERRVVISNAYAMAITGRQYGAR